MGNNSSDDLILSKVGKSRGNLPDWGKVILLPMKPVIKRFNQTSLAILASTTDQVRHTVFFYDNSPYVCHVREVSLVNR